MTPDPCRDNNPMLMYEVWDPRDENDRVGLVEACFMNDLERDRFGFSMVRGMETCLGIVFFGTN